MKFWKKLFSNGETEEPTLIDEEFPIPDTSGLDESDIDSAVEVALAVDTEAKNTKVQKDFVNSGVNQDQIISKQDEEIATLNSAEIIAPQGETEVLPNPIEESFESTPAILENKVEKVSRLGAKPMPQIGSQPDSSASSSSAEGSKEFVEKSQGHEIDESQNTSYSAHDHLEDLSAVDGQILPELQVPDWRQELEFAKERYEPCDLTNHIAKVSKRRFVAKRIDLELSQSQNNAYQRYLERATRRFKEKIDEEKLLNEALRDLSQWKSQQSFSVSWKLADRINEELLKAKTTEAEAISFIEKNTEFNNPEAIVDYRNFVRRTLLIPLVTVYLSSVIGLTYNRFEWILKFVPPFNLGLSGTLIIVSGISSGIWLSNLWRYAKKVSRLNKRALTFEKTYREQEKKISHAVSEHTRLSQQEPMVEPILQVLAKAYRVQLQSDTSVRAHATTFFDPNLLPACVTLARAEDNDELKMAKLKRRALSVLMKPGWRTHGLDRIARIHADSRMLDSNSLSLRSLDTDSLVSARNAQRLLLEAFSNYEIHSRVSKERLREAIGDLHTEVLAKWESGDRPTVVSLRDDGFSRLSFRSSWLEEQDVSEDWIEFLGDVLHDDTSPFSLFNIENNASELNDVDKINSLAVVPNYFEVKSKKLKIKHSPVTDVLPMDVVVRVDVSPWANPSAFAIFSNSVDTGSSHKTPASSDDSSGDTGV